MVFAKDKEAAGLASRAFQRRAGDDHDGPLIHKFYVALSSKKPKKKHGLVTGDMEKSRRGGWRLLRTANDPAITRFDLLGRCGGGGGAGPSSLRAFLLKPKVINTVSVGSSSVSAARSFARRSPPQHRRPPASLRHAAPLCKTGRTHQLRVALKSVGAPIFGDPLYSSGGEGRSGENVAGVASDEVAERCYLHACALRLETGKLGLGATEDECMQVIVPPQNMLAEHGAYWAHLGERAPPPGTLATPPCGSLWDGALDQMGVAGAGTGGAGSKMAALEWDKPHVVMAAQ